MNKTFPLLFLLALAISGCKKENIVDEPAIPDTGMYVSTQFTDASFRVYPNVVYSTRPNFRNNQYTSNITKAAEMASNTLQMKMDIAVPPNAVPAKKQPLIVFIHGGGFVTGDKTDMTEQALSYARAGYVVASINYRLTQNQANDSFRLLSRLHAIEDAGNAIRFLKAGFQTYHIDTTRVLTLGSSAGGGLSLVNALEADAATSVSDFPGFSTRVQGAISTGASLTLDDLMGITISYNASDAPVLMFHANPLDGSTGATWQAVLDAQQRINNSGNNCTVSPQPNLTHTVWLELGGTYWPVLKKFIWEKLRLAAM